MLKLLRCSECANPILSAAILKIEEQQIIEATILLKTGNEFYGNHQRRMVYVRMPGG